MTALIFINEIPPIEIPGILYEARLPQFTNNILSLSSTIYIVIESPSIVFKNYS